MDNLLYMWIIIVIRFVGTWVEIPGGKVSTLVDGDPKPLEIKDE